MYSSEVETNNRAGLLIPMRWTRKRYQHVVADEGYNNDELRRYCARHGMKLIITR